MCECNGGSRSLGSLHATDPARRRVVSVGVAICASQLRRRGGGFGTTPTILSMSSMSIDHRSALSVTSRMRSLLRVASAPECAFPEAAGGPSSPLTNRRVSPYRWRCKWKVTPPATACVTLHRVLPDRQLCMSRKEALLSRLLLRASSQAEHRHHHCATDGRSRSLCLIADLVRELGSYSCARAARDDRIVPLSIPAIACSSLPVGLLNGKSVLDTGSSLSDTPGGSKSWVRGYVTGSSTCRPSFLLHYG